MRMCSRGSVVIHDSSRLVVSDSAVLACTALGDLLRRCLAPADQPAKTLFKSSSSEQGLVQGDVSAELNFTLLLQRYCSA